MEYNDEQILNLQDYEKMAKAYDDTLKNKGFNFRLHVSNKELSFYNGRISQYFSIIFTK